MCGHVRPLTLPKEGEPSSQCLRRDLNRDPSRPWPLAVSGHERFPMTGDEGGVSLPYQILKKETLAEKTHLIEVSAPEVARKAQGGQFVIVLPSDTSERITLTIADYDRERGTISIIFLEVGTTTELLATFDEGDELAAFAGPLGNPTHVENVARAVCVGGGVGIAAIHPVARALREAGSKVTSIIGAKSQAILFWEDEMRRTSDNLIVCTDDGSYGRPGFVTDALKQYLDDTPGVDLVFAVGPTVMMRAVCKVTEPYQIKTIVSLNPIMVDGTGMCGGCRVTVAGKSKFACVDGPDFDGHQVDFDELMARQRTYIDEEQRSREQHRCRLSSCGAPDSSSSSSSS